MTEQAHTFTPENDSLAEKMKAYQRVQHDYDAFKQNTKKLDEDTLGEKEDVQQAGKILQNGLKKAFKSIDSSELKEAQEKGDISSEEVVSFMQAKHQHESKSKREKRQERADSHNQGQQH